MLNPYWTASIFLCPDKHIMNSWSCNRSLMRVRMNGPLSRVIKDILPADTINIISPLRSLPQQSLGFGNPNVSPRSNSLLGWCLMIG